MLYIGFKIIQNFSKLYNVIFVLLANQNFEGVKFEKWKKNDFQNVHVEAYLAQIGFKYD